jgi:kojibiose phosphorylase
MSDRDTMQDSDVIFMPTSDPRWVLIEEGFNLAREHEIESLFAVSNGYIGSRASLTEGSSMSAPATFIAGVFDIDPERAIPELAAAPDWMQFRGLIGGTESKVEGSTVLDHRRILDLRQGIWRRVRRFEDPSGRVTHIRGMRLVSLADRHLLVQTALITPENYSDRMDFETAIVPPVARPGYLEMLEVSSTPGYETGIAILDLRTRTGVRAAFAARSRLRPLGDGEHAPPIKYSRDRKERWEAEVRMGQTYRLERVVAVYTSRDTDRPAEAAAEHLREALADGVDAIIAAHIKAWEERWRWSDVEIEGDRDAQRAIRFACYHLIGAANPDDERVSIGARALTGPSYKGHVFWDTEIYMLPFYTFTHPASARALLMYRYHTLPGAREKARNMGYSGAMYAWESADTGDETTPPFVIMPNGEVVPVLSGLQEHHITADVAYAVWQYWKATGDDEFFERAGAEIMLETARFWASRTEREDDGRYHIRRIVGPDEYHETVDDNAFTNVMAQWNLERGLETARLLTERWPERFKELAGRLSLSKGELREWETLAERMYTGFDPHTGLFEQHRGYFGLEYIDLAEHAERAFPMDVVLGRERTQRSQVVKQADVLMLVYLLWDRFSPAVREANFLYYEPRTSHGSSLSPSIHALLAARLSPGDEALRYFRQAAEIDLANNMGNAAGGVHAAAIGGLWQAVVSGFAGMRMEEEALAFDPHLPSAWRALRFRVQYRGQHLSIRVDGPGVEIAVEGTQPVKVRVGDTAPLTVLPGRTARWEQSVQYAWKEVAA